MASLAEIGSSHWHLSSSSSAACSTSALTSPGAKQLGPNLYDLYSKYVRSSPNGAYSYFVERTVPPQKCRHGGQMIPAQLNQFSLRPIPNAVMLLERWGLQGEMSAVAMQMFEVSPENQAPFLEQERIDQNVIPAFLRPYIPHNSDLGVIAYHPDFIRKFQQVPPETLSQIFNCLLQDMIEGDKLSKTFMVSYAVPDPQFRANYVRVQNYIPFLPVLNPDAAQKEGFIVTERAHLPVNLNIPIIIKRVRELLEMSIEPATIKKGILLDVTPENLRMNRSMNHVWVVQHKRADPDHKGDLQTSPFFLQAIRNLEFLTTKDGEIDWMLLNQLMDNFPAINPPFHEELSKIFVQKKAAASSAASRPKTALSVFIPDL